MLDQGDLLIKQERIWTYLYDSPLELKSLRINSFLLSSSYPFVKGNSRCWSSSLERSSLNNAMERNVDSTSSGGSLRNRFNADFIGSIVNRRQSGALKGSKQVEKRFFLSFGGG